MKLLIELPTWLGDTIMVTPAIENIVAHFEGRVQITLVGSPVSIEALRAHPNVVATHVLKKSYFSICHCAGNLGRYHRVISFRRSLRSTVFLFFVNAGRKYQFSHKKYSGQHQVEKYNSFVNRMLRRVYKPGDLSLTIPEPLNKSGDQPKDARPLLGINPGAAYGSAKRWSSDSFAQVAAQLSSQYDILILGGPNEIVVANEIVGILKKRGVAHYKNLAGQTTVTQLIQLIARLDLFVTNDSGPMHIAAAFKIPTVATFGPTCEQATGPWRHPRAVVVRKHLTCTPCMQRTCPLGHHDCMQQITPADVLSAVEALK